MKSGQIAAAFKDQTIFITGATGVLGEAFIGRLFASCKDFRKIYVLIREKKGKSVEDRLNEFFEADMFKIVNPQWKGKVEAIAGDCAFPNLGISKHDWRILAEEVTIVVHICASIKFDEEIRLATKTNIKAVEDILKLGGEMKNLKCLMYISTAYSNCVQEEIKEQFYEPPMQSEELYKLLEDHKEQISDSELTKILRGWPNTYTFTKAIAENVIKKKASNLPVVIVRPSIVFMSHQFPDPGFTDRLQGLSGMGVAAHLGLLHVVYMKGECRVSIVPSDLVINYMCAILWYRLTQNQEEKLPIYNYTHVHDNPITWGQFCRLGVTTPNNYPSIRSMGLRFVFPTRNHFARKLLQIIFENIPAYFFDLLLRLQGQKPMFVKVFGKMHTSLQLLEFFTTHSWVFESRRQEELWQMVSEEDKQIFDFNTRTISWEYIFGEAPRIIQRWVLKEKPESIPLAKQRIKVIRLIYCLIGLMLIMPFLLLMYKVFV